MPEDDALGLMPVVVSTGGDGGRDDGAPDARAIEIDISGVRICVAPGFDPEHLARVIAAVRVAS